MFDLQRLRPDHEGAVLAFERENRAYFVQSISDRGDAFFDEYPERHRALMGEQDSGEGAYFVLVDDQGAVIGRFNLYGCRGGSAEVGYRVAQRVAGRGVATSGLQQLCRIARQEIRLSKLRASTSNENLASQRVLAHAGFVFAGPTKIEGRRAQLFELDLAAVADDAG